MSKCKVCEVRDTGTHLKDSLLPTSEETGHNPKKSMGTLHVAVHLCHMCSRWVPALSFLNTVTRSIPCSNWAKRQSHKSEHILNGTDQSVGRTEQSDQTVYLAVGMLKKIWQGCLDHHADFVSSQMVFTILNVSLFKQNKHQIKFYLLSCFL